MDEVKEGDAWVRRADGTRFTVKAVTGAVGQFVTLAFQDRKGVVVVSRHELVREYDRTE